MQPTVAGSVLVMLHPVFPALISSLLRLLENENSSQILTTLKNTPLLLLAPTLTNLQEILYIYTPFFWPLQSSHLISFLLSASTSCRGEKGAQTSKPMGDVTTQAIPAIVERSLISHIAAAF